MLYCRIRLIKTALSTTKVIGRIENRAQKAQPGATVNIIFQCHGTPEGIFFGQKVLERNVLVPLLQRFRKGVQVNAVCLYQSQLQGMAGLTQAVFNTSAFLYELLQLRGLFEYGSTLHVGKVWSELTVCLLRSLVKRDSKNLSNSFMPFFSLPCIHPIQISNVQQEPAAQEHICFHAAWPH